MKPEDIKIIAFDLDGTLLNENKEVTPKTLAALERASSAGLELLISTGRGLKSLPPAVTELSCFDFAIISNGAHIVDLKTRESVYSKCVTEEMLKPAMKYIEDPNIMREIFCNLDVYADKRCLADLAHYGIVKEVSQKYVLSTRNPVDDTMQVLRDNFGRIENINLIFADLEKRLRYMEALSKIPSITVCSSLPWNIEIGPENSSKAIALKEFARMRGFTLENCMTFGDSSNDAEMVKAAGIGVAMENGTDELKACADFVTLSNEEDGCAYAIEEILGL